MKHLLLTTIAAVVLVGCGPSVDIWTAARDGNIEVIKQHLDNGVDVNSKDESQGTALHLAAVTGHKEIVELLIAKGADVDAKDNHGWTPLHYTVSGVHKEIVEILIAKGADVRAKTKDGESPLDLADKSYPPYIANLLRKHIKAKESIHGAAEVGNIEAVKQHLDAGVHVNAKTSRGMTPLHYAANNGHMKIVELLISRGADVNAKEMDGGTALHIAAIFGQKDIVELLLVNGADLNLRMKTGKPSTLNGKTALDVAEMAGPTLKPKQKAAKPKIAALLRENGGKTGEEINNLINSTLTAAKNGNLEDLKRGIAAGVDVNVMDELQRTPLFFAAESGFPEVVNFLLSKNADINTQSLYKIGWDAYREEFDSLRAQLDPKSQGSKKTYGTLDDSPLLIAAKNGHAEIVEILLSRGADLGIEDRLGLTVLHGAVSKGQKHIVGLLISNGLDVNGRTKNGRNPLHVVGSNKEIAELLIEKRADVNAKDDNGTTPLDYATGETMDIFRKYGGKYSKIHFAAKGGNILAVMEFLDAGDDVNAKDNIGKTPLHQAASDGDMQIAELLIDNGANVNAKDAAGQTPLGWAKDESDITNFLRKHGGKTREELKAEGK